MTLDAKHCVGRIVKLYM